MLAKEIREKTNEELLAQIDALKEELFKSPLPAGYRTAGKHGTFKNC